MKGFRRFHQYLKPYKGSLVAFSLLSLLSVVFSLVSMTMAVPFLQILFNQVDPPKTEPVLEANMASITEYLYYILGQSMGEFSQVSLLAAICLLVIILFFLRNFTTYISLHILAPMRVGVIYNLRKKLFSKITDLPLSYFNDQRKGDILTRMSADVVEVEWSIMNSIVSLIRDPFMIVGYLGAMFFLSYKLTIFTLILLPVSAFVISTISRSLKRASITSQGVLGNLISIIEETLGGIRIVKAFNAQHYVQQEFDKENDRFASIGKGIFRKRSLSSPMTEFLGSIIIAIVMWFGGNIVLNENLDAAVFITYIILFSQVITPAKSVSATYYNFQKGLASIERIEEILETPNTLDENVQGGKITGFTSEIVLQDISFDYGGKAVLEKINIRIPKGSTIALVGPSGAGKSTLADLVCRFYDPKSGEILVDGHVLSSLNLHAFRELLGIVPQVPVLFHDTITANIAFGDPNPDMEKVKEAARLANAHEFIKELPQGYFTQAGDMGVKLSGGQRQRISIARALYKDPPILVLDEATSSLDAESEKLVQEAINRLLINRTVLVIAHRLSTIRDADNIIVLNEGKVVEEGKHEILMQRNGVYAKLFEIGIQ